MKVVRAGLFLVVLAALATVSMVATDFQLFRYTNIVIYALALIGMNLLVGYNGQVSLGHRAFYAIGAYATALMVVHAGARTGWRCRWRARCAWWSARCSACRCSSWRRCTC